MNHKKLDLVNGFVHDISSPVLIISLAIEELQSEVLKAHHDNELMDPKKIKKNIEMIYKNTLKASDLIQKFRASQV